MGRGLPQAPSIVKIHREKGSSKCWAQWLLVGTPANRPTSLSPLLILARGCLLTHLCAAGSVGGIYCLYFWCPAHTDLILPWTWGREEKGRETACMEYIPWAGHSLVICTSMC